MRTLVIHPVSNYNIGDMLTYRGTQELLRQVDSDIEFLMFDMWRAERELNTYMSQFYWGDVDLIVLAGSPWLWFELENSAKYKILMDAVQRFTEAKKLALGIGSCFPLGFLDLDMVWNELGRSRSVQTLQDTLGTFDLVMTRDYLAQGVLERAGIESFLAADTSWLARGTFNREVQSDNPHLCIFQDPSFSLSKISLSDEYIDKFVSDQLAYIETSGAEVYTISAEDAYAVKKFGLSARYVADLDWMAAHMSNRLSVLSGRVHMGALAHIMNVSHVQVLPLDSRFLTLLPFRPNIIRHLDAFNIDSGGFTYRSEEIVTYRLFKALQS